MKSRQRSFPAPELCPLLTTLVSHSALSRSNTTALQQLPVGDQGGRMKSQTKGSAVGGRRLSARLKKRDAFLPQRSARPSSHSSARRRGRGGEGGVHASPRRSLVILWITDRADQSTPLLSTPRAWESSESASAVLRKSVKCDLRPSLYR